MERHPSDQRRFGNSVFLGNERGRCGLDHKLFEDLPPWFELHPTEVCGYAACLMMEKKLKDGYKPTDKTDGPNLWRAVTGDRIVWVTSTAPQKENPVKAVVGFETCALVYGERQIHTSDLVWHMSFGAPLADRFSEETAEHVRTGVNAVRALGHLCLANCNFARHRLEAPVRT